MTKSAVLANVASSIVFRDEAVRSTDAVRCRRLTPRDEGMALTLVGLVKLIVEVLEGSLRLKRPLVLAGDFGESMNKETKGGMCGAGVRGGGKR